MYKVEEIDGGYTYITDYNYSIVNLEVPANIKALESGATIDVENAIDDLKWGAVETYLKSDFEMSIFDNASNATYVYQQYDANNKIIKEVDLFDTNEWDLAWVNGDYYYEYCYGDALLYKDDVANWTRHIMVKCFTFDEVFENCIVNISADGQYYELILPSDGAFKKIPLTPVVLYELKVLPCPALTV